MIRLGVIGLGQRLSHLVTCFQAVCPDIRVVGVVDPDEGGARKRLAEQDRESARFYPDVSAMLRDARPDAIAIGTRCDRHARDASSVAEARLPLFLEKPVAITVEEARMLQRALDDCDDRVVVSFPLRFSDLCLLASEKVSAGAIGRPQHLLGVNYVPYGRVYFEKWYRDIGVTGGLFLQKATHDFDYLAHLAGAPIMRVAAMAQRGRVFRDRSFAPTPPDSDHLYYDGVGSPETGMNEDACSTLLEFANGAQGLYTQVFYTRHHGQARGATISGVHGTLRFDWYRNELTLHHHREACSESLSPAVTGEHFGGDLRLASNFLGVIRGQQKSGSPLSAGLRSVFACLAARESAATGRFVDVPQI